MIRPLLAGLFVVTLAQGADLAAGQFLVASRELGDPNFAETVVLLVRYDEQEGAMGLIVNRRSDLPLSRVFENMKEAKDNSDPIYVGGPVESGGVLALLKSASKPEDAQKVFADVYLISSKALLAKALAAKTEAVAFHAFLGYAGWGPGQLEHEISLGAWHIMPAAAGEVFHSDPDSVWPRLIKRTETRIAEWGGRPRPRWTSRSSFAGFH
ncbi:MAG TPA: YqgE/AlgH family protein [Bryobacteraceae bacterium]|nr:YqgE/AlgH family protein [Bryobacteraceae bacterium]